MCASILEAAVGILDAAPLLQCTYCYTTCCNVYAKVTRKSSSPERVFVPFRMISRYILNANAADHCRDRNTSCT